MDYLKQKRLESGKSTREIYEQLGISRIAYYKYEVGIIKNIPHDKLIKLADILNFDINEYMRSKQ